MSTHLPIALTMGDAAGIGGEVLVKAFATEPALMAGCFVAGDLAHLRRAAAAVAATGVGPAPGMALPVALIEGPEQAHAVPAGCLPVVQVGAPSATLVPWGQVDAQAGRMAAESVIWAARQALRGEVAAVVTAPLHKEALAAAGVAFPGHTELLQAEAAAHLGRSIAEVPVRMMLASPALRVVLVSIHVSLRQAIEAVTFENVLQTLRITHAALSRALGHPPRIAVAGLNPHAGEGGLFGREEIDFIAPAVTAARAEGMQVEGPRAPDTIFMRARHAPDHPGEFDVVVAMYHDQGLIPVKYLGLDEGVNVTLGLPLVRTSPDHGTAFDIAGSGRADPASLLAAVRSARSLVL
ncbi:MAG: 4-hydroxythreonine-4-phosphate dehydrogenase PdxA [Ramlibacter sp.]|uniref:4-hydroxythreonine-4-phosphate dehydrogenase PdxA n=1 Tax=Ramlibacter sp. TaxID=1917967 RepID=UPI002628F9FA|nr:4-hydroxythreonine-4-phosphate dehydrogenase PdxA [Ramlibacter sp.]MDH4375158.1 4-hydroxythreonine-4-phosphate dehydrogenase PdxA [Ramlibacter sp.]